MRLQSWLLAAAESTVDPKQQAEADALATATLTASAASNAADTTNVRPAAAIAYALLASGAAATTVPSSPPQKPLLHQSSREGSQHGGSTLATLLECEEHLLEEDGDQSRRQR